METRKDTEANEDFTIICRIVLKCKVYDVVSELHITGTLEVSAQFGPTGQRTLEKSVVRYQKGFITIN